MRFKYFCISFTVYLQCCYTSATCPTIVSRKDWDGLKPVHIRYLTRPVDLVIIQHTVTPTCATDNGCAEIVRNIQTYQMDNLNFWDIGQSFLIGGNGKVYEGPGWLHAGAHTYGYNTKSIGISFIGNFNNDQPTAHALNAAKALIKCGVELGHLASNYHVVAHRQLIATESPGRKLYNEIRSWPDWTEDIKVNKDVTKQCVIDPGVNVLQKHVEEDDVSSKLKVKKLNTFINMRPEIALFEFCVKKGERGFFKDLL